MRTVEGSTMMKAGGSAPSLVPCVQLPSWGAWRGGGLGQTQTCPQQELWSWGGSWTEAKLRAWGGAGCPLCFDAFVTCWPSFPEKTGPSHGSALTQHPSWHPPNLAAHSWGPAGATHLLAHTGTRPRQLLPPPLSSGCLRMGSERPVPGGDQAGTQAFLCFWEAERQG